jgi:hypothetical protein
VPVRVGRAKYEVGVMCTPLAAARRLRAATESAIALSAAKPIRMLS